MNRIKLIGIVALFFSLTLNVWAAEDDDAKSAFNPLQYGVPSLTIAADARGGGMGDIGAATEPDVFSQYWNPAKYPFAYSRAGVAVAYTPWLRQLIDDIDLAYLAGFFKLGYEENQAIGISLRYFGLGEINMKDWDNQPIRSVNPYEMAADVSYSLKFSDTFAAAAAFRFIYSDLGLGDDEGMSPGTSFAVDLAGYYNNYVMLGNSECLLGLGFNASNIGSKISFTDGNTRIFIPANLRIGASLLYPMDDYNTIAFSADLNKLMVPTTPDFASITDLAEREKAKEEFSSMSPIKGLFNSFHDAPGGFKEELQEITWSVGAEYAYDNQFFVRGGYFHEHEKKGNRRYFSVGAGFKMTAFQMDVAYLISTVPSNPLDQTLRFSLSFDMDGLKNLFQ